MTTSQKLTKIPSFEYTKTLLEAGEDVPYRTCTICNTQMSFTTRQFAPQLISCKCRGSGETALCPILWDDLRTLLAKGNDVPLD